MWQPLHSKATLPLISDRASQSLPDQHQCAARPSRGGPGRGKLLGLGEGLGDMLSPIIYSLDSMFLQSEVTKVVTKRSQAARTIFKMSAA